MGPLKNSRHELFCQELVSGKSATQAYKDAGYSPNGAAASASTLLRNPNVAARVIELKKELASKYDFGRDFIIREALADREEAKAEGQYNAAAKLLELAGKTAGAIVDRVESKVSWVENVDDKSLDARIAELNAQAGIGAAARGKSEEAETPTSPGVSTLQ